MTRIHQLRGDSSSIRERAYCHVQRKIASRQLISGMPVSDAAVASELGSSRTPVREALRQLLSEGFLEQTESGNLLIRRLTVQDISDLFEMREALETFAVRKVSNVGLSSDDEFKSREFIERMNSIKHELKNSGKLALEEEQMWRFESSDIGFHTVLIRASANLRSHRVVNELRHLINIFLARRKGHSIAELEVLGQQHSDLLGAILARKPDRAVAVLSEHIRTSKMARLEQFAWWERETSLQKSVPVYFAFNE